MCTAHLQTIGKTSLYQEVRHKIETQQQQEFLRKQLLLHTNYPDIVQGIKDRALDGYFEYVFPLNKKKDALDCAKALEEEGFNVGVSTHTKFCEKSEEYIDGGYKLWVGWL